MATSFGLLWGALFSETKEILWLVLFSLVLWHEPLQGIRVPTMCDYDMDGTFFLATDAHMVCCSQCSLGRSFD